MRSSRTLWPSAFLLALLAHHTQAHPTRASVKRKTTQTEARTAHDQLKNIRDLGEILEKIATQTGEQARETIPIELVYKASDDYAKLSPESRAELDRQKFTRMLADFALIPAKNHRGFLKFDSEAEQMFVERLGETYAFFRPAYLGKRIGEPIYAAKHPKCKHLLRALALNKQTTTASEAPVNLQDFRAAKGELETWLRRFEQLRKVDDIYSCLDELKELFNLLNHKPIHVLRSKVFPRLGDGLTAEQLLELFGRELQKVGYKQSGGEALERITDPR